MKNKLKAIAAAAAAFALIGTASIGVSATTADDVVAAARGAGFLEEYVQMLRNFLNTTHYNSDQYDTMVGALSSAGEEMDDIAMRYFGKTIAEMKGEADQNADVDAVIGPIVDKFKDDDIQKIVDHLITAGKDLDLDITAEKKGDKNYVITVKDKDGNVQLVAPIGQLIDRTGVEEGGDISVIASAAASAVAAAGCVGAVALSSKAKKNEE